MAKSKNYKWVAHELAESWINGNHVHVIEEIGGYRPIKAALIAILLCNELPERDQDAFANVLFNER
jgi:hypothetical protein